ncbi:hypothetical protein PSOL_02110 [Candidatus Phytoplasma solani]
MLSKPTPYSFSVYRTGYWLDNTIIKHLWRPYEISKYFFC